MLFLKHNKVVLQNVKNIYYKMQKRYILKEVISNATRGRLYKIN